MDPVDLSEIEARLAALSAPIQRDARARLKEPLRELRDTLEKIKLLQPPAVSRDLNAFQAFAERVQELNTRTNALVANINALLSEAEDEQREVDDATEALLADSAPDSPSTLEDQAMDILFGDDDDDDDAGVNTPGQVDGATITRDVDANGVVFISISFSPIQTAAAVLNGGAEGNPGALMPVLSRISPTLRDDSSEMLFSAELTLIGRMPETDTQASTNFQVSAPLDDEQQTKTVRTGADMQRLFEALLPDAMADVMQQTQTDSKANWNAIALRLQVLLVPVEGSTALPVGMGLTHRMAVGKRWLLLDSRFVSLPLASSSNCWYAALSVGLYGNNHKRLCQPAWKPRGGHDVWCKQHIDKHLKRQWHKIAWSDPWLERGTAIGPVPAFVSSLLLLRPVVCIDIDRTSGPALKQAVFQLDFCTSFSELLHWVALLKSDLSPQECLRRMFSNRVGLQQLETRGRFRSAGAFDNWEDELAPVFQQLCDSVAVLREVGVKPTARPLMVAYSRKEEHFVPLVSAVKETVCSSCFKMVKRADRCSCMARCNFCRKQNNQEHIAEVRVAIETGSTSTCPTCHKDIPSCCNHTCSGTMRRNNSYAQATNQDGGSWMAQQKYVTTSDLDDTEVWVYDIETGFETVQKPIPNAKTLHGNAPETMRTVQEMVPLLVMAKKLVWDKAQADDELLPKARTRTRIQWKEDVSVDDAVETAMAGEEVMYWGDDCLIRLVEDMRERCVEENKSIRLVAHNGGRFDTVLVKQACVRAGLIPDGEFKAGGRVLGLVFTLGEADAGFDEDDDTEPSNKRAKTQALKMTFADTVAWFLAPLAKLPKVLGFDQTGNGKELYPYTFLCRDNLGYRGALPDQRFWGDITDSDWVDLQRAFQDRVFDLKEYTEYYCRRDVTLLTEACARWRYLFLDLFGIDPLTQSYSAAGLAIRVYRTAFLKNKMVPTMGPVHEAFARSAYAGGRTEVFTQMIMSNPDAVKQHLLAGGIPKLPPAFTDPTKWTAMKQRWVESVIAAIRGSVVHSDADKRALIRKFETDPSATCKLRYLDVTSLYPSQMLRPFPSHSPQTYSDSPIDGIKSVRPLSQLPPGWESMGGTIECVVRSPGNVDRYAVPIVGLRAKLGPDNKFCFGLPSSDRAVVITMPEYRHIKANPQLYAIVGINRVDLCGPERDDIFDEYIGALYPMKEHASKPQDENHVDEYIAEAKRRFNFDLDREQLMSKENPGLRAVAKLLLNSTYGRLALRFMPSAAWLTWDELQDMVRKHLAEDSDIHIVSIERQFSGDSWRTTDTDRIRYFVRFRDRSRLDKHLTNVNVLYAAYVTAYGRQKTTSALELARLAGCVVAYCDTDSIVIADPFHRSLNQLQTDMRRVVEQGAFSCPDECIPEFSSQLGCWDDEYDASTELVLHVALSPKMYAQLAISDGKPSFKVRGKGVMTKAAGSHLSSWFSVRKQVNAKALSTQDAILWAKSLIEEDSWFNRRHLQAASQIEEHLPLRADRHTVHKNAIDYVRTKLQVHTPYETRQLVLEEAEAVKQASEYERLFEIRGPSGWLASYLHLAAIVDQDEAQRMYIISQENRRQFKAVHGWFQQQSALRTVSRARNHKRSFTPLDPFAMSSVFDTSDSPCDSFSCLDVQRFIDHEGTRLNQA